MFILLLWSFYSVLRTTVSFQKHAARLKIDRFEGLKEQCGFEKNSWYGDTL